MSVDNTKVTAFINALKGKFEEKSNKKDDVSGDFSSDTASYPTVKAMKGYVTSSISGKSDTGHTHTKSEITDFPALSDVATSGDYDDLTNKPVLAEVATSGDYEDLSNTPTLADVATSGDYTDLSNTPTLADVATSGDYGDLDNTPSLSDLGGVVDVEKQQTAETGYVATYVIKQDGTQVGSKINIPKDYLVKSGTVNTVGASGAQTASQLGTGYANGDKYIDFVINTKDNDGTDEHIYINVKDLVEDTTYTADESTIQLSNGQFSVKTGGIALSNLASGVQTSLGYADAWNSSVAHGITQSDITAWNGKSNLTTSDVDSEIEAYLTAITNALSA